MECDLFRSSDLISTIPSPNLQDVQQGWRVGHEARAHQIINRCLEFAKTCSLISHYLTWYAKANIKNESLPPNTHPIGAIICLWSWWITSCFRSRPPSQYSLQCRPITKTLLPVHMVGLLSYTLTLSPHHTWATGSITFQWRWACKGLPFWGQWLDSWLYFFNQNIVYTKHCSVYHTGTVTQDENHWKVTKNSHHICRY